MTWKQRTQSHTHFVTFNHRKSSTFLYYWTQISWFSCDRHIITEGGWKGDNWISLITFINHQHISSVTFNVYFIDFLFIIIIVSVGTKVWCQCFWLGQFNRSTVWIPASSRPARDRVLLAGTWCHTEEGGGEREARTDPRECWSWTRTQMVPKLKLHQQLKVYSSQSLLPEPGPGRGEGSDLQDSALYDMDHVVTYTVYQ